MNKPLPLRERSNLTALQRSLTLAPTVNPVPAAYRTTVDPARRAWIGYVTALLVYSLGFGLWHIGDVPPEAHLADIVLVAICLVPITLWYAQATRGLPMFELICLSYATQFALPLYLQPNSVLIHSQAVGLAWPGLIGALWSTVLGVGALVAGYYATRYGPLAARLPIIDLPLAAARRGTYLTWAVVLGLAVALLQALGLLPGVNSSFGAVIHLLPTQLTIATILLASDVYRGRGPKVALSLLLYGLVAFNSLLGLTSGLLENAILPLLIIFIVHWHVTRRISWRMLLVAAGLFLLLNPAKEAYRVETRDNGAAYGLAERVTLWFDLSGRVIANALSGDIGTQTQGLVLQSLARFDLLHKFAYVQQLTPSVVPYYNGATYSYFFVGLIPRALWPDKPSASDANATIDVDYGLLDPYQTATTTIAIGQLPEAFANFGLLGILIVMLLQGAIFATLDRMLNGPRSEGGQAIYLSFMVLFLNGIGSSSVILFAGLVQTVLANVLILRPFATGFRAPRTRPER